MKYSLTGIKGNIMRKISDETIIVMTENVVSCDINGETAILNLDNEVYYGLNQVGTKIWNLIQKPVKFNEIVMHITNEYDLDTDRVRTDIYELIEDLIEQGLVSANECF